MRLTESAAEAELKTPKGLSPALIGKVVTIRMTEKEEGRLLHETLTKLVGVLKSYSHDAASVEFLMDGAESFDVSYSKVHIEFVEFDGA